MLLRILYFCVLDTLFEEGGHLSISSTNNDAPTAKAVDQKYAGALAKAPFPSGRWNADASYDPDVEVKGKS